MAKRNAGLALGIITGILLLGISIGAAEYLVIEFKSLPDGIITNIPAFPVTGRTPLTTSEVFVNNQKVIPDFYALNNIDFFTVADLSEGTNDITVRVVDQNGSEDIYSKRIEYSPYYSTGDSELVYANAIYGTEAISEVDGVIVIDVRNNYFLGIIKNQRIIGITRDGSEIIMQRGERYSTATHAYTGRILPDYSYSYYDPPALMFSHDGNYVYYENHKVNIISNSIEATLLEYIGSGGDISYDDKKIVTGGGYIDLENDTFIGLYYSNGSWTFFADLAIDPTGKYVSHSSFHYAEGKLTILDVRNAAILKEHTNLGDYAGDIVFSPDGRKMYAGFYGNTFEEYSRGGILIYDMKNLKSVDFLELHGARSLAVSKHGKVYASAFYTRNYFIYRGEPGKRGIIELVPTDNGKLKINKVYFVSLESTVNEPYYGRDNIFYKAGVTTLYGDVNGDCIVNIFDLGATGLAFGSRPGDGNWNPGTDLNGDGKVNILDLATVGLNYGKTC